MEGHLVEKPSTEERVFKIVAEQFGIEKDQIEDKITSKSSFDKDLGADSLDVIELIMELEEEFDVSVPDEASERFHTVRDVIKWLEEQSL